MLINGTTPTAADTVIYTVPQPSVGKFQSGNAQEINIFRFVNSTAGQLTLSIWINVNGIKRLISPLDLILPAGAAWDDIPVIQLPVGATIIAKASGTGVDWSLNAYFVNVVI